MAGDVLVIAEHNDGKLDSVTFELLGKGRELSQKLGGRLAVLVLGVELNPIVAELSSKGADVVIVAEHAKLDPYIPEIHSRAIAEVAKQTQPSLILFGHTYRGIEMAPAVATKLGAAFASNCVDLEVREGALFATRSVYEGTMRARVKFAGASPWIASVQKGALPAPTFPDKKAEVLPFKAETVAQDVPTRVVGMLKPPEGKIDITKADIIVSVGRGIKSKENVKVAEELASALGGVVACSRPVADMGWLPPECHVGMSGKTVSPRIYLACGISGASQHTVGIKDSKVIIAVNSDANAPIFRVAHYGTVGDMFKVLPALTEEAKHKAGA